MEGEIKGRWGQKASWLFLGTFFPVPVNGSLPLSSCESSSLTDTLSLHPPVALSLSLSLPPSLPNCP